MTAVAVLFGGPSPEHDVSVLTGLQAARALLGAGGQARPGPVRALYWSKAGDWFEVSPEREAADFADGTPPGAAPLRLVAAPDGGFVTRPGRLGKERRVEVEVVLNCLHGGPGEDGTLQGALDLAGLAHAGPTVAGAALGMDKLAFGAVVAAAGLPCLPRQLLGPDEGPTFTGPYIVKPRYGGSSIGIEVVADRETALARLSANPHLRQGAVVEPYRPDLADVQVALRSWPELSLSAIERPLRSSVGSDILSYGDKYTGGEGMVSAPRELPAQLAPSLEAELRRVARRVATLSGLRGVARLDFLADDDRLYVNELNTVPGSLAKYLWVEPEVAFPTLLADMLAEALARPAAHFTSSGADGSALRSAGAIADKLG